ncbi:MAG: hypothetical protein AAB262_11480 [Elusimicrobiota bacterium]
MNLLVVGSMLMSFMTCVTGKSAVHELEGLVWLLIAVVSFIGAGVLEMLGKPK